MGNETEKLRGQGKVKLQGLGTWGGGGRGRGGHFYKPPGPWERANSQTGYLSVEKTGCIERQGARAASGKGCCETTVTWGSVACILV
jgi:hypothetical protein